jgi:hypothetical protein
MALPVDALPAFGGVEFDARMHDSAFLEEIDLYSELIIVAATSVGAMTVDAIDRALGLMVIRA